MLTAKDLSSVLSSTLTWYSNFNQEFWNSPASSLIFSFHKMTQRISLLTLKSQQKCDPMRIVLCKTRTIYIFLSQVVLHCIIHIGSDHYLMVNNIIIFETGFLKPDLLKISWIILSYLLVDCFEFRTYLTGRCLCSQNINKYSNKPAKGYERIIQRF